MRQTIITFLLASAVSWAQGPRGPQSPGLDTSKLQTVEGTVASVHLAYGAQFPSAEINKTVIQLAPLWFFLENNFELKAGDKVKVTAAPRRLASVPYLYAIEITNTATGAGIRLRDDGGFPLWSGGAGIPPAGRSSGSGCVDPASIQTASGVVEKVVLGAGIQMPALILKTADGKLLTLKIGPERILLDHEFDLNAGDQVTARYALATCTDEYLALQLTNAAGVTLTLRNDDGTPAW